jgi:flagellar hook-associated protein FlgK
MSSTFGMLGSAFSGLNAARTGIEVTGQNIANANTEGYTRQRVEQSALGNVVTGRFADRLSAGYGVSVTDIARLGSELANAQVRSSGASASYWSLKADALSSVEAGLNEPSDDGISAQLGEFWSAWEDLGNDPGSTATRAVLLEKAGTLLTTIQSQAKSLEGAATAAGATLATSVDQVNSLSSQIAILNADIQTAKATGVSANAQLDQRDQLVMQLATLTGATVRDRGDGAVDVVLGGNAIVEGSRSFGIETQTTGGTTSIVWSNRGANNTTGGKAPVTLGSGSLAASLETLGAGGAIATAKQGYDSLASSLASSVNAIFTTGSNEAGTANGPFFGTTNADGTFTAASITVVATVSTLGSANATQGPLDGSIAQRISQLANAENGPDAVWSNTVTAIGTAAANATQQSALTAAAATSAAEAQLSQSSVDMDEETANLLKYQHAYQGAARVISAIDEMLDTLINRTGVVGR